MDQELTTGQLMASSEPKDKIILRLVSSLHSHPAYANMTSDLILALHGEHFKEYRKLKEFCALPGCEAWR